MPPPEQVPLPPPSDPAGAPEAEVADAPMDAEMVEAGEALEAEAPTSELVVTGSRIRRKDLAGPAPVVMFTREQILASGRTNVGDFLQTMPEQSNAINRGTNNSGDGSIRVNLRGIGEGSTLVLLNGRRLSSGGLGADDSVDLTAVPTNVIERIEILKDGASAIYGSDAIAGVVNIITRKRYNGAEANAYGNTTTHGDGASIEVDATIGSSNDRGGVLFSAGFARAEPIWAGNRDFSRIQRGLDLSEGGIGDYQLGSPTNAGGVIWLPPSQYGLQNGNSFYNDIVRRFPNGDLTLDPATGQWRQFGGPELPVDGGGGDGFNFQPYNYLVTPQERFQVFSAGDFELDKNVRVFYDAFYTKRSSSQILAPEPLNTDAEGILISRDNLYNPFGRDFDAFSRRLLEFDGRGFRQDSNNFHLTAGLDGDLPDSAGVFAGWFWDLAFNYNRNETTEIKTGSLRNTRLQAALGPSFVDETGTPVCGTPDAPIEGCVPLNLFGGPGTITRDMVENLRFTGVQRGYNELIGAQANFSGEMFKLAAKRAVGLAVGYEFRAVSGGAIPDPVTVAGETTGNKGLITEGKYRVHEIYGELNIPIVEKLPALEALEVILAGRGSFYDTFGSTFNYKLGARWAPMSDFALRATYSTAFRAPSIPDLYEGTADDFQAITDPCASGVEPGSALERSCGEAANNGDSRQQLVARVGGNPNLEPEKAKIFTVGLVVQPSTFKNLSLTLDYFNTLITQRIDPIGGATIIQGCYPANEGDAPAYCELIERDEATGRIQEIQDLNENVGEDHIDGIDMSGRLELEGAAGRFDFLVAAAYLRRYDRTLADGTLVRGAGTWDLSDAGKGGAFPHWRFNVGLDWGLNGFSAGVRTYFIGSYRECGDATGDLSGSGLCFAEDHVGERSVDAYNTWDLVLGYGFRSGAGLTSLSLGVTNLFDVAPPRVYNGFGMTTDTYSYDMAMRTVYARVGHQF